LSFEGGELMNTSLAVQKMKRYLAVILILLTLGFAVEPISSVAVAAGHSAAAAQTRRYRVRRKRSFWQKHRDKLTVAGTALGGAAIGGIAGGKKGAAIGSLVGAGGGALYTYKIRKRRPRRY
jgi:outer membrane lipoprotein SlyB